MTDFLRGREAFLRVVSVAPQRSAWAVYFRGEMEKQIASSFARLAASFHLPLLNAEGNWRRSEAKRRKLNARPCAFCLAWLGGRRNEWGDGGWRLVAFYYKGTLRSPPAHFGAGNFRLSGADKL